MILFWFVQNWHTGEFSLLSHRHGWLFLTAMLVFAATCQTIFYHVLMCWISVLCDGRNLMLKLFWGLLCLLLHMIRFGVSQLMEMWGCCTQCSRSSSVSLGLIWNVGYNIFDFLSFCFHERPGVFKLHNVIWGFHRLQQEMQVSLLAFFLEAQSTVAVLCKSFGVTVVFSNEITTCVGTSQDVYVWVSDSIWHGIQECDDLL